MIAIKKKQNKNRAFIAHGLRGVWVLPSCVCSVQVGRL